MSDYT